MGCGGSAVMDLEPIEERAEEFSTWVGKFDSEHRIPAAFSSAADVPALLAEVERLRAKVDRLMGLLEPYTREYPKECNKRVAAENERDAALAVVRDHLPVKPDREAVARALALVGDYDGCFERLDAWAAASSEARECGDVEEPMSTDGEDAEWWLKRADAVLSLLPGRSEVDDAL